MSGSKESSDNDLSTPDEEKTSSFHTPKHVSTALGSSLSGNVIASQDSIDVFHDAFSSLHASYKTVFTQSPSPQTSMKKNRHRHLSSGTKFDELKYDRESDDEAEDTRMLTKRDITRIRKAGHKSYNELSRSCNGSPYHFPRFSFSTNSLKRNIGSGKENLPFASPKRTSSAIQGGPVTNYKPSDEVEVINESDESVCAKEKPKHVDAIVGKTDVNLLLQESSPLPYPQQKSNNNAYQHHLLNNKAADSDRNKVTTCLNWKPGYVPCVDINSLYDLSFYEKNNKEPYIGLPANHCRNIQRKRKCCDFFKEEFQSKNFKLTHGAPHLFVTSQWQQVNEMCCVYLAYRLFWGVYFLMWAIWSWIGFAGYSSPIHLKRFYPIFFTNWGIWILAFDTMFQAVNVALHLKKISEDGDAKYCKMKTSFKVSWLLSNITSSIHIFITLFFWLVVYPHKLNPVSEISINTHIIPCLYVILDCFISATPRRILHAYYPMLFVFLYGLFTDIYYLFGGKDHKGNSSLYPLLNWNEQFKTLLIGSGLVLFLIPVIHFFVYTLFVLRVKLWRSINYSRYSYENDTDKPVTMEEKV